MIDCTGGGYSTLGRMAAVTAPAFEESCGGSVWLCVFSFGGGSVRGISKQPTLVSLVHSRREIGRLSFQIRWLGLSYGVEYLLRTN